VTSHDALLADVITAAQIAGDAALAHFGKKIAVTRKLDGSPVTIADREAEQAVRDWITERYPGDAIIGEELGTTGGTTGQCWFVDPIDGTKTFVRGVPLWGSLIGVAVGQRVVAGAIYCPAADLLVAAADGCGCTCNGVHCRVSDVHQIEEATILATDTRFLHTPGRRLKWEALGARVAVERTWGDCYGYALVASGRAELMADDRLAAWDAAALMPIVREAGGVFTDWLGNHALRGEDALATNGSLAVPFRRALGVPVTAAATAGA
jgi:histidinol phosphatase-like enzyme (inositol monophosphatase family)